jgi:hypothetical protein
VSPVKDVGPVAGNSGFEKAIIGAEAVRGFENIADVVIVADNDDVPAESFKSPFEKWLNAVCGRDSS